MACEECAARAKLAREAFLNARISEALGHIVKGAAEIIGVKEKTGVSELKEELPKAKARETTPVEPVIDDADSAQEYKL